MERFTNFLFYFDRHMLQPQRDCFIYIRFVFVLIQFASNKRAMAKTLINPNIDSTLCKENQKNFINELMRSSLFIVTKSL